MVQSIDLPDNCFAPLTHVRCCFQIWKKNNTDIKRTKIVMERSHADFKFLTPGDMSADLCIKGYGSNCGTIVEKELSQLKPKS
jgi:hypothetical protein